MASGAYTHIHSRIESDFKKPGTRLGKNAQNIAGCHYEDIVGHLANK